MPALKDGYQTLISFAADSSIAFWEKTVTPPGIDGGDAIPQTTMQNAARRTKAPRSLVDQTDGAITVAYDPAVYDEIEALVNVNNLITVTFSDGSTYAFWGWLKSFVPGELVEGEQPEAEIEVIVSNMNASDAETAPVYTAAP